jgi:DNA-binding GntR family transcriptional regulator
MRQSRHATATVLPMPTTPEGSPAARGFGGTNYHRVRDALRQDIVSGVFGQGEWLKIAGLAERYGLSSAPIREALNQLEAEGLVELLPNRGARVRLITRDFIADLFEIRLALEPMMAQRSAAVARPEHVEQLVQAQAALEEAMASGVTQGMITANQVFHRTLFDIRPNQPGIDMLKQHSALVSSVRRHYGFPTPRFDTIIKEHNALIDACRNRDGRAAYRVMRIHVQHSIDELLPRIPSE